MIEKVKNYFLKMFDDNEMEYKETSNNKNINYNEHRYYTRLQAINIANKEKNLRTSVYKEAKEKGVIYGLIEFDDFYSTLVIINNIFAWYIKVIKGKYDLRENDKNYRNKIEDNLNIRCLVYVDKGKYEYLNDYYDTRNIRMASEEEFLEYINNVKK